MQVESISFVFRGEELAALLKLLECKKIPYCPLGYGSDDGLARLEEALLVTRSGEQIIVDSVTAFCVKTIDAADRYVCAFNDRSYLGLFYSAQATMVLQSEKGLWRISPFRRFGEAREVLCDSVTGSEEFTITMQNTQGQWSCAVSTAEDAGKKLSYAAEWMYFDDIPQGKDAALWKP